MRLILKEYLLSLKEKDELDILLCNVYAEKGYITDSLPKTGNRQYGVDIQMHGEDELLLFVVKQGNINRQIWDGDINSVRQSLDEIKDVAVKMLTPEERKKSLRVIVATNGLKEEAIKNNWNGYVTSNKNWDGINVSIEFIGIDDIVNDVKDIYFNENLFNSKMKSSLRRALYFIDADVDYNSRYYEQILDSIILEITKNANSQTKQNKTWALFYMISQMIAQYAHDAELNRIAIMVTEYSIIQYWKYLYKSSKFEKETDAERLNKLINRYIYWNSFYLSEVESVVDDFGALPNYNPVESRVTLYEILGFISTYEAVLCESESEKTNHVMEVIIKLLNRYAYYKLPPYDISISVIITIINILDNAGRIDDLNCFMENIANQCILGFRQMNLYPAPTDSYEEALRISRREKGLEYLTSSFWGYFMLLIKKYDNTELFNTVEEFVNNDLKNVCKCVWFIRATEEELYYEKAAMNRSGEGIEIIVSKDYTEFVRTIDFILKQYENEMLSFDQYGFSALENIVCRYYSYIPRVKIPR